MKGASEDQGEEAKQPLSSFRSHGGHLAERSGGILPPRGEGFGRLSYRKECTLSKRRCDATPFEHPGRVGFNPRAPAELHIPDPGERSPTTGSTLFEGVEEEGLARPPSDDDLVDGAIDQSRSVTDLARPLASPMAMSSAIVVGDTIVPPAPDNHSTVLATIGVPELLC